MGNHRDKQRLVEVVLRDTSYQDTPVVGLKSAAIAVKTGEHKKVKA